MNGWFHMGLATTTSWVLDLAGCGLELGVDHGVATGDFDVHVVDDGVHMRDGVALGLQFLAVELERDAAGGVEFGGRRVGA